MRYVKERNFIVAYDGTVYRGKWDILTNQFYGVRGGIVKTRPVAFNDDTMRTYLRNIYSNTPISDVIYMLYSYSDTLNRSYNNEHVGQRLEEVISVGLCLAHNASTFKMLATDTITLNKECVEFLKENYDNTYSEYAMDCYKAHLTYKDCFTHVTDEADKSWIRDVLGEVDKSLPTDYIVSMIRRAVTEKVRMTTSGYGFSCLIKEWATALNGMEEEIKVYHNILSMYAIIRWRFEKYKKENYDALLKRFNDKPFLYFEDDRYITRPLITRVDFHTEATRQDNCVESNYMDEVAQGTTYIVGVRLKSDPETPYITCEVDKDGDIVQFLRRFNNYPDGTDKAFQLKFQTFIKESMKEPKAKE